MTAALPRDARRHRPTTSSAALGLVALLACATSPTEPAARAALPVAAAAPAAATDAAAHVAPTGHGPTSATAVIPVVPLGQPFQLAFDHLVRAGDTGVRLRFGKLLEDSRCPRGATCVWAGRVRVEVALAPRQGEATTVELSTEGNGAAATAAGLTLELHGVEPLRSAGAMRPPPEAYVLTLVVRRTR
jgi:hypothetical protein